MSVWGSTVGYIFAEAMLKFLYSVCKGERDMSGPKFPTSWKISLTLSFAKGFCELPFWLQFPGGVGQERHLSVYPHFALTVFTITHFTCCLWQIGEGSMDDVKGKIFLDDSYNTVPAVCRHLFDLKLLPTSSSLITLLWSFWALVQTI